MATSTSTKQLLATLCVVLVVAGCTASKVFWRVVSTPFEPAKLPNKITHPERRDARLAVLWVGHATVLVQMDDRYVLTDPVFTRAVGVVSTRLVEPGIAIENLPRLTAIAVSHMHMDHLSFESLDMLTPKSNLLVLPAGALSNMPRFPYEMRELGRWESVERDGMRITAVPVRHVPGRWGLDSTWSGPAFTGYVFEYHGLSVYFGGDAAWRADYYRETREHFPSLDLAMIPICPMEPRSFMRRAHLDPAQALEAFELLGAKRMLPIHFDTFINSADRPGECPLTLLSEMSNRNIGLDRVALLSIGEQRVLEK
jgi:L-ascorbate metabolism protein UlaG (beta-lactamase superfamily)